MINEITKKVNFQDLGARAKVNCIEQYIYIFCPYEGLEHEPLESVIYDINVVTEEFQEYWFDANGDWYEEGRKMA